MSVFDRLPNPLPDVPATSGADGVACALIGENRRSLAIVIEPGQAISINPKALLWKDEAAKLIGDPNGVVLVQGPGRVGLALGFAGDIFPLPLHRGDVVQVQSGHFLFSAGAERRSQNLRGLADRLSGSAGTALDMFRAGAEGAVVWVQAASAVLERNLAAGEALDIRQDAFLAKDDSVGIEAMLASGEGFSWPCIRLTGPGRVALQIAPQAPTTVLARESEQKPSRASGIKFDFPFGARR